MIYNRLGLAISDYGLEFIESWEGMRLKAYRDVKGIWTIGIGHIRTAHEGMEITLEEGYELFRDDVQRYVDGVNDAIKMALTQRQYDACVSLCFNIGVNGFKTSSVAREINKGNYKKAADKFLLWNKVRDQGRLVAVQGLTNRRRAEREVFLEGTPEEWL